MRVPNFWLDGLMTGNTIQSKIWYSSWIRVDASCVITLCCLIQRYPIPTRTTVFTNILRMQLFLALIVTLIVACVADLNSLKVSICRIPKKLPRRISYLVKFSWYIELIVILFSITVQVQWASLQSWSSLLPWIVVPNVRWQGRPCHLWEGLILRYRCKFPQSNYLPISFFI